MVVVGGKEADDLTQVRKRTIHGISWIKKGLVLRMVLGHPPIGYQLFVIKQGNHSKQVQQNNIYTSTCMESLQIKVQAHHSSYPPRPPLSRTRPVPPTLALPFDFRPPNSLYISRMSPLLGRDTARASLRHCSSFASLGDW